MALAVQVEGLPLGPAGANQNNSDFWSEIFYPEVSLKRKKCRNPNKSTKKNLGYLYVNLKFKFAIIRVYDIFDFFNKYTNT